MLDTAIKTHCSEAVCQEHAIFTDVLTEAVVLIQDRGPTRRVRLLPFACANVPFYVSDIRLVFYINGLLFADFGELSYI